MSASAHCAACGAEATATCNHCDNEYCADHIAREAHNCLGEFTEDSTETEPSEPAEDSDTDLQSGYTPYHQREGGGLSPPPEKETQSNGESTSSTETSDSTANDGTNVEVNTSSGRFIGGAIIFVVGALMTLTGVGFFIGIPMGILGFGIMFPRFTVIAVFLAAAAFIWLVSQI